MSKTLQNIIKALPIDRQKKVSARYRVLAAEVALSDEALFDHAMAEGDGAAVEALGITPDDLS